MEKKSKKTELNSYKLIIKELGHKKKVKSKESARKKISKDNNKILSHYNNIFEYFNSLSGLLFFFFLKRPFYKKVVEYEIIMCNNIKAIFKIAQLPLAQLAEHSTFIQGVGRSNRLRETI